MNELIIWTKDQRASFELQREFAAHGILVNRLSREQAVRFGLTLSLGKASVEGSPEEFLQLVKAAPESADAFFDTIERFKDRVKLLVNGKPKPLPLTGKLTRKPSFEEFTRGL